MIYDIHVWKSLTKGFLLVKVNVDEKRYISVNVRLFEIVQNYSLLDKKQ